MGNVGLNTYVNCNEAEGVCYPEPEDSCNSANPPVICDEYQGVVDHQEWNNGKGPLLVLDNAEEAWTGCVKDARADYDRCMAGKERVAETMCRTEPSRDGRSADNRKVVSGQEAACQDGWVHGVDAQGENAGRQVAHGTSKGSATQIGGGAKLPIKGVEITISGSHQWNKSKSDTVTDSNGISAARAERPGWDEECQKNFEAEVQQCGPGPFIVYP